MTADAPISLPSSRALLGWWHELAPHGPKRLWAAHALIHRVEALVEVAGSSPLEQLQRALLAVVAAERPGSAEVLAATLGVPADVVRSLVAGLEAEGLIGPNTLQPTPAGREARAAERRPERRSFAFLDGPSAFVALEASAPMTAPPGWRFDLAALEAAIARPADWKAARGFPADVTRLLRPPAELTAMDSPRVAVDRAEQAFWVLAEVDGGRALAFATRPEAWSLGGPIGSVPVEDVEAWAAVDDAAWRAAWQLWARARSLPATDVDASRLEPAGGRLRVAAPGRLIEKLRQGRSESLDGHAWLLAGSGRVRAAACLELTASEA